ncbi:hypothetical protein NQ315_006040 [Exocentrus adspersus]|uniref:Double jelly roll-like domain-containing protein n=1 Tax=Exocentrus adspersus TaxID=1586481 RepID=A0AAV8VGB1_9CUCU|nr:hypothetical protein NQ315_006040 [Exocentrus adspersus]
MSTNQRPMFNVFRKVNFDDSIEKIEWRTYYPYTRSFRNNDIIEIVINQSTTEQLSTKNEILRVNSMIDIRSAISCEGVSIKGNPRNLNPRFIRGIRNITLYCFGVCGFWALQSTLFDATYDSQLLVSGKIIKTGDGDVSFVNNAPAFMFSSVKYILGGGSKEMELVQDPGIVSTVRGYLCYTSEDSKHLAISGWNFPNSPKLNPDGTFTFLIPLRHFFNIFNDYRTVICGMQTFTFTRANNDANCFIVKEKTPTSNTTVKMDIQNVELKIKRIYPESGIKEKLLEGVAANNSIIMPYRQWDVQVKTLAAGAISDAWAVKTTSHVESPRYVIKNWINLKKDPTYFNHINITNIKLSLNAERFPTERMRLNFDNNDYNEAHFRYTEFQSSYLNCSEKRTILDYDVFKERTLFVIDCSRRDENERPSTVDVRLEIEAAQGFPENTRAYCIIIHDCIMEYLPLDNIVNNLKA